MLTGEGGPQGSCCTGKGLRAERQTGGGLGPSPAAPGPGHGQPGKERAQSPREPGQPEQPRGKRPTHVARPRPVTGKNDPWASASQHWCPTEPTVRSGSPRLQALTAGRAAGAGGCQEGAWLGPVHCFRPPATRPRRTATAQTPAGHGARREPPRLKARWPGLAR